MKLGDLINISNNCGYNVDIPKEFRNLDIKGLCFDSRKCANNFLFGAFKGISTDGMIYIHDAIARGAKVILTSLDEKYDKSWGDVCHLRHENPRCVFGQMVARFFGQQPEFIAAITGTNGKTSVAHFCRTIWEKMGKKSASIGTLGVIEKPNQEVGDDSALTTPDPLFLHETLARLAKNGITHLSMEASSHGLDQWRLAGVNIKVAGITNISRDHLDYHGTHEKYIYAKMMLFRDYLENGSDVMINADIAEYESIVAICNEKQHKVTSFGKNGKDIKLIGAIPNERGQVIIAEIAGKKYEISTRLMGTFQASNLLCAIGMVMSSGLPIEEIISACNDIYAVTGRMEKVANHPSGAPVIIDYAHTPDALEKVLLALRPHTKRKLVVVFGCGGNRDRGKRPIMGALAEKLADTIIITDDNPRKEDPAFIRSEILSACKNSVEIGNRKEAIEYAIKNLQTGDILLLAGKGHEKYQIIGETKHRFDETQIARDAISSLK